MIYSFPPIEPDRAAVLILGTMPSVRSLEQMQYYGHPQNQFWKLIFALWNLSVPHSYSDKVSFLHDKGIALWDVLQSCERKGSMDSQIKSPNPNDILSLAGRHSELHTIFFNSKNAQILFDRLIDKKHFSGFVFCTLPSSSPARAMRFEDKLAHWSAVRDTLNQEQKDE
ncbi:MAG: DNA-deoxyinosine glycosylase [Clostridiales bacterium]|jgi:hypoxanthine-DNA glycosylase|nr:DNA-deoxyinosine glycosylase [Clostridiales bacterium]